MSNRSYQRVERAIRYLAEQSPGRVSLATLAEQVHLSPSQFQREFSAWAGISPDRFARVLTREYLRHLLTEPLTLDAVADAARLSSASRLHDLVVTLDAVTPDQARRGGSGLEIVYGVGETRFGPTFVAMTERGICSLQFQPTDSDADQREARARLISSWPESVIREDPTAIAPVLAGLGDASGRRATAVQLQVRGTNFQVQVWRALLAIPEGQVATYKRIATAIGKPTAARAVGNAVGANPVGWLIPCHRVIRETGALGGYRWGLTRKYALLTSEACRGDVFTPSTAGNG